MSRARVVLAFILTPLLISFAVAVAMPFYEGLPNYWDRVLRSWPLYVIVGAIPATVILGIPAFLLLKKLVRPTILWCALAGGVVAALPWFLFMSLGGGADQASINGHVTQVHGHYTAWGWLYFAQFLGLVFVAGAVGGILFWAIAAATWPRRRS